MYSRPRQEITLIDTRGVSRTLYFPTAIEDPRTTMDCSDNPSIIGRFLGVSSLDLLVLLLLLFDPDSTLRFTGS